MSVTVRRLVVAVLLVVPALVVVSGGPAAACPGGPMPTVAERVTAADDVFSGLVASRTASGTTVRYSVNVDTVYKGSVSTEKVTVTTDSQPRACGVPALVKGGAYLFFTQESGGELTTNRHAGTAPATAGYVARVEALLGSGHPAVSTPAPAAPVEFTTVAGAATDPQRLAAPGIALVIVGLLGLGLAAWRGRRRA